MLFSKTKTKLLLFLISFFVAGEKRYGISCIKLNKIDFLRYSPYFNQILNDFISFKLLFS